MPPAKKIDLLPAALRERLKSLLAERGFADIVEVTEELNFWLEEEGLELSIGKSAVGEFSRVLKDQRDAFSIAEAVLADFDIEQESMMQKALMQMLAASAVQLIQTVRENGEVMDAKGLMALGRMLKDLMASSGLREQLLEGERQRIREERDREQLAKLEEAVANGEASEAVGAEAKRILFGF
ncbi:MAG: DUF3486 family protein [Dinoroseobacter sp.]|nr:DUF3486 family protein [Dinoroseobacter sp.]